VLFRSVTRQNVKVCGFTASIGAVNIWQFTIANDADKITLRLSTATYTKAGDCVHFQLSKDLNADGTVNLDNTNLEATPSYDAGCGLAVSPDGAYTMHLGNMAHDLIGFNKWDRSDAGSITLNNMATWGAGAFGLGTNNNRWSCNDPKWLCLEVGWGGRDNSGGSNQVLCNWVDHQIIRTSNDAQGAGWYNDFGDFWVGNPSPIITQVVAPSVSLHKTETNGSNIKIFDLLGRELLNSQNNRMLKKGVYFVQHRDVNALKTEKLIVR
jgi:hypothetical protein